MKYSKLSSVQQTAQRLKARYLIVLKGYSQKEAAEIIGVSRRIMCNWNKKYNWNTQTLKAINKKGGIEAIMADYFKYIENNTNSEISLKMKRLWDNYLMRLDRENNTTENEQ